MIRLNKIFGRRTTQDHDPQPGAGQKPAFDPPDPEDVWDEALADAYLMAQEQVIPETPAPKPPQTLAVPIARPEPPYVPDQAPQAKAVDDRAAMARRQLDAVQDQIEAGLKAPGSAMQVPPVMFDVSASELGQTGRRVGRVKTRLLGFDPTPGLALDPIEAARATGPTSPQNSFPVGWIVVTRGPGKGAHFALFNGVSQIGRGDDQAIKLDFGDGSISRSNHAAIAYDYETNGFFLGHGGKTNIVRLNDRPVISTETLATRDLIRIGETTLLFVALCGSAFQWSIDPTGPDDFDQV